MLSLFECIVLVQKNELIFHFLKFLLCFFHVIFSFAVLQVSSTLKISGEDVEQV